MQARGNASGHRIVLPVLLGLVLTVSASASARIKKTAIPCKTGMCLYWWPELTPVQGWHHDQGASLMYAISAEAPDGYTFSNAVAVIYAKATYKPRVPQTKSLEMLIENDKAEFLSRDPTVRITEMKRLRTGNGNVLRSYTFIPEKKGNWEEVSYGEEGDFYLLFVISSRTKKGLEKGLGAYKEFINHYK